MKKAQFNILVMEAGSKRSDPPKQVLWSGYKTETLGLVVCRKPEWVWFEIDKPHWGKSQDAWQIVHESSGCMLPGGCWYLPTCKIAMKLAKGLGRLTDWTQDKQVLIKEIFGRGDEVRAIFDEALQGE